MYSLSLIILIGLIAITGIRYDRAVRALVDYSSQHGLMIFGQHRKSRLFLMSTPGFFGSVMSRQKVEAAEDSGQRALLHEVRRYAIAQAWTGLLIVALFAAIVLKTRL